jgi:hypothetical protein
MDIINHFIDFMTCEMQWGTGVTIKLFFHISKRVFHWNIASMFHIHYFS